MQCARVVLVMRRSRTSLVRENAPEPASARKRSNYWLKKGTGRTDSGIFIKIHKFHVRNTCTLEGKKVSPSLVSVPFSLLMAAHQNNFCFDFKSSKRESFHFRVYILIAF